MPEQRGFEKRYRVLVVDDEQRVLETLAAVLSDDLDVVTATSAAGALRCLEAERFHVVCTDFKMPGMNGVELLRRVSQLPYPVGTLLVTGADEYFRSEEGNRYYVLLKPFNHERLISLILQLARIAEMKRSVGAMSPPTVRPGPPSPEPALDAQARDGGPPSEPASSRNPPMSSRHPLGNERAAASSPRRGRGR